MFKDLLEIKKSVQRIETSSLLQSKTVLTIDEAAAFTGYSKNYIYQLTCGKKIPYYRPNGGGIYFSKSELETWLKRNRVPTEEEIEQEAAAKLLELDSKPRRGRRAAR